MEEVIRLKKKRLPDWSEYFCLFDEEFMDAVKKDDGMRCVSQISIIIPKKKWRNTMQKWAEVGDVREWEAAGHKVKTYQRIRARELWNLITFCATYYSAEPVSSLSIMPIK